MIRLCLKSNLLEGVGLVFETQFVVYFVELMVKKQLMYYHSYYIDKLATKYDGFGNDSIE